MGKNVTKKLATNCTKYTNFCCFLGAILLVGLFLALDILIGGTTTAVAQEDNPAIELEARAGFDGYYKQNMWLPVQISAANSGPSIEGDVRVTVGNADGTIYNAPLSLPTQSNKQLTLIIHPANHFTNHFPVDLHDENVAKLSVKLTNRLTS